jgi:protein gp37
VKRYKNCYAKRIAIRHNGPDGFKFAIHCDRFDQPRKLRKPEIIFVNSMSDLFHEKMPLDTLKELFGIMADCQKHTFMILTKRHKRLAELAPSLEWHPNIWMGVSVENQANAELRIPYLLSVPARVLFLSVEPLVGPTQLNLNGIHLVLLGCESGPRREPMDVEWARNIRDQCKEAGTAFFMKQMEVAGKVTEDLGKMPPDLRIREWPKTCVLQEELFVTD